MPNSRPDAADMLKGVRGFLENDLLPDMAADRKFNLRVAINMLATVERELRQGPALNAEEARSLSALLGHEAPLEQMNEELCALIREGKVSPDDPALRKHLRQSIAAALAINNPKWAGSR
jgi:hypothetical protein